VIPIIHPPEWGRIFISPSCSSFYHAAPAVADPDRDASRTAAQEQDRRHATRRGYPLKKSTLIASCLVNSNLVGRLEDAEFAVVRLAAAEFPDERFADWNTEIDDHVARQIIHSARNASPIRTDKLMN
jgi:hypothetical protein